MYLSLPFTKVWVKQSFLQGSDNFIETKDPNMLEGYLVGIRATPYEPPLYEVYIPKYNACYDKVMQNAIFNRPESPDTKITLRYVGWWDCISDNIELYRKSMMTNCLVSMQNREGYSVSGTYLFTIDFNKPYHQEAIYLSESKFWSEHKSCNYFFCDDTGVLCCGPNNKLQWLHSSLAETDATRPPFRVFDAPKDFTHEDKGTDISYSAEFDYEDSDS
jgi:hypothetical protein